MADITAALVAQTMAAHWAWLARIDIASGRLNLAANDQTMAALYARDARRALGLE